ncbi:MAG TPA: GNAT family N-acetyltransferase [Capsulimonadaceae bacterium]
MCEISVRELTHDEMPAVLPLVESWNSSVPPKELSERLPEMLQLGYRCIAAFADTEIVGIAGFWFGCRFWCGRYIDVDNVIVHETWRDKGIGNLLMAEIHGEAETHQCDVAVLDAYLDNIGAHRFYQRLGYEPLGYHFVKRMRQP